MGQPLSPGLYGGTLKRIRAVPDRTQSLSRGVDRDIVRDIAAYHAASTSDDSHGRLDLVRTRQDRPPYLQRRTDSLAFHRSLALASVSPSSTVSHDISNDDTDDENFRFGQNVPVESGNYFDENDYSTDEDDDYNVEDFDGDFTGSGSWDGVSVVYTSYEGISWEVGWWPDIREPSGLALFQIVLDVLTETIGSCRISALRVRDNLHRLQAVSSGLELLREMSVRPESSLSLSHSRAGHESTSSDGDYFTHPITGDHIDIVLPA